MFYLAEHIREFVGDAEAEKVTALFKFYAVNPDGDLLSTAGFEDLMIASAESPRAVVRCLLRLFKLDELTHEIAEVAAIIYNALNASPETEALAIKAVRQIRRRHQ